MPLLKDTQARQSIVRGLILLLILSALATTAGSVLASPDAGNQAIPLDVSGPSVTISTSPANVQVGADFTINATFSNTSADPGYGPFIDLYIPHGGIDGLVDEDLDPVLEDWGIYGDGITDTVPNSLDGISPQSGSNYSATYLGSPVTVTTLTIPDEGTDGRGCVEHPLAIADSSGAHAEVCGYAGDQLVVIELPFGSFTQDQPAATVNIPVHLSDLADLGTPLNIGARGGFEYGDTPLVDFCCNPLGLTRFSDPAPEGDTWAGTPVNPTIATFTKSSVGDVPTGPNYPRTFTLELDIAEGQTIDNLVFTDTLNANLSYLAGTISCTPAATTCEIVGNALTADFGSVTGTSAGNDAVVTFEFYFNDTVLPSATGGDLAVNNTANFNGNWDTIDARDPDTPVGGPGIGTATATVISASKSASQNDIVPGDIVEHTISFSVSDYFALENIIIPADTLSDGQHYFEDGTRFAKLTITNNGSSTTVPFTTANFSVTCNYTGAIADGSTECDALDAAADDGTTTLTFDISGQITEGNGVIPIHPSGQLIGGYVNDGDASTAATSGTITYYSEIQDAYTDSVGEASLNSNDEVSNSFDIQGELLDTTTCPTGTCTNSLGAVQTDGGSTTQSVPKYALNKSVYAVNGTLCSVPNACDDIAPADVTTYRITYDLVSGDFEELKLTDYLPLPIFHVNDPLESGAGSHTWTEDTPGSVVTPAAGQWSRGPADTQYAGQGIDPTVNTNTTNNALIFNFGTYADTSNTAYTIDLLFSATVSDEPFADGLNLTNQVEQSDQNTGSQTSSGTEIVQITLSEPVLIGEKSAVATDNPDVTDYSDGTAPNVVTFLDPSTSGVPWTGTINSEFLDSYPISADISGVDAGDLVTFVIIVENSGGADGFDVKLKDTLPGGYVFPAGGVNLQVHNGNGDSFGFASLPTAAYGDGRDLFENGIEVVESGSGPGACQAHSIDSGLNVLVISYDLQVDPNAIAGQEIQNIGELVDYSGSEGGPGHLEEPEEEGSTTTLDTPTLSKTLIETEIDNVNNDDTEVTIGELVKYQIKVTLPEGNIEDLRVMDYLAPFSQNGLAFHSITRFEFRHENSSGTDVGDASGDISYDGTLTYPAGTPVYPMVLSNNGQTMTFDFGTLHNGNNDNTLTEVLVIEYYAIVMNISAMQEGDSLQNRAYMYYDTYEWNEETQTDDLVDNVSVTPVSGAAVTVVEPTLTIDKSVENFTTGGSTYDAGDTARYTFVIENTSSTDAYNVAFTDQFPFDSINGVSKLDLSSPNINIVSDTNGTTPLTAANLEIVDLGTGNGPFQIQLTSATDLTMEPGRVITFTVDAVIYSTARAQDLFDNTAYVEWTSLPTTDATQNDGTDEVNRSTDDTVDNDNERTGADGKGGALDDYADDSNTSFNITTPTLTKQFIETEIDNSATTNTNSNTQVVIGELVKYQLRVELPEGDTEDFRLVDYLGDQSESGLAFHSLTRFDVRYEDSGGADAGDASGDISYTGTDNTFGSITAPLTLSSAGHIMTFDFGTLHNDNSNNALTEVLYIEYYAIVQDIAAIQAGDSLQNRAYMIYDTYVWNSTTETDDLVDDVTVGPVDGAAVTVIEPTLTIAKSVANINPGGSTYDAGDTVRYTFVIENTSSTDAYNVDFYDQFPYDSDAGITKLDFPAPNITVVDSESVLTAANFEVVDAASSGAGTGPFTIQLTSATNLTMIPGQTITITVDAVLYDEARPDDLFDNTAYVEWTSLPTTDATQNGGTDEVDRSTDASVLNDKERDGSGGVDDYIDSDSGNFTTPNAAIVKDIIDTGIDTTWNSNLTEVVIGEMITYQVVIAVPEGEMPGAKLSDHLDDYMSFVDVVGITYGSAISASNSPEILDVQNSGQDITIDFGTLTNSDRDADTNDEYVVIRYRVLVLNNINNQSTATRNNQAQFSWETVSGSTDSVQDSAPNVTVIEPTLEVTKSVYNDTKSTNGEYDAGDSITYTIVLQHASGSETEAYDVDFTDTLPADGKLVGLYIDDVIDSAGVIDMTYFTLDTSGDPDVITLNNPIPQFDPGRTVTIVLQADIYTSPYPGEVITNTADITWSSLPDTNATPGSGTDEIDRSTYNTSSDERDGSDGVGGTLNDYADSITRNLQVEDPGAAKFVFATDQTHTQDEYLVIGETVTYAVRITLPESLTPDLKAIDYLPAGLQFVPGTQALVTSAAASDGLLTADFSTSGAFQFDPTTPYSTSGTGATGDPQTITFDFDPITVPIDGISDNNSFLLTFDAIVLNDNGNQHGDTLTNNISTEIGGTEIAGTPVDVEIIEPELTINKTGTPTDPTLNEEITYQIVVENPNAPNPSDPPEAFEVVVTDVLPTGVTLVGGSITNGGTYASATRTITWVIGDMPTNTTSATLEYKVTVDAYPTNSIGDSITNDAVVTWSSIDGTPSIERDGSGGVNDYTNDDSVTVTVTNVDLTLTKDDGVTNAVPGDDLAYALDYENVGNVGATNVVITETVPDYTTFDSANSTAGWSCVPDNTAGSTCTIDLGTVAAGASGTVTFAVDVDSVVPATVNILSNSASIADDGTNGSDPTPSNNTDDDTDTTITAAPDIAITKDDGETTVSGSQALTYTLTVYNNGDQDATGVDVSDTLPEHVQFVSASDNPDGAAAVYDSATHTVTWPSFDLAGGGTSVNLTVNVTVFDPFPIGYTEIYNQATAADDGSNGTDPTPSDNTDDDTDTVNTSSALGKAITATDQTETSGLSIAAIGEVVTYQIRVTLSEESYTSLRVFDDLPTGMEYVSGSLVVSSSSLNGTLPAETLTAPGGSGGDLTIDFGATTVTADGDDDNNSFIIQFDALVLNESGNQNGDILTNNVSTFINGSTTASNTDSVDIDVVEPELSVGKSSNNTTPNLDDTITYTITVDHLGTSTENAYDLVIVDTLPAGLEYQTGTANPAATYNSGTNTLTWTVASFDTTASALTFSYDATVVSASANPNDDLDNTVDLTWTSLSGSETGERTGAGGVDDHQTDDTDTVTYSTPDLALTKDDGVASAEPSDTLSYTLNFVNNGNVAATGTIIIETVPAYTTFNETASGGPGIWSCANGSPAGTICTYNIGTLAAGASSSVTFAVNVYSSVPATVNILENTASISDDGTNGTDPTPSDNTDTDSDTINAQPDIAVSKTDGLTVVAANSTLTYTITVQNLGDQDATGVAVTDTLPAEVTFVSASDNPDGAAASYNSGPHTVTWDTFDLDAGATETLTVVVTVNDPMNVSSITNMVEAQDDGTNGADSDSGNNTATDTDAKSGVSKTLVGTSEATTTTNGGTGQENVTIGEILTYEVIIPVPGNSNMDNLVMTDLLDEGLAFMDCVSITPDLLTIFTTISGSMSNDFSGICANPTVNDIPAADPTNPIGDGRQVIFNFGDIGNTDPGAGTLTVRYRAVVLDVPENTFEVDLDNEVDLTWIGGAVTGSGTPTVNVVEPDLDMTKSVDRNTAANGQIVTYTLDVFTTPEATSDAFDVLLTDEVPVGIEYVPGSLTYVSGVAPSVIDDSDPLNLAVTWDHFPLGQTAQLTFQATVVTSRPGSQIVNSANVAWSSLPGDVTSPQSVHNSESTERHYDPAAPAGLYTASASAAFSTPALPDTGFAPGVNTDIPAQPDDKAYADVDGMFLEIPSLGLYMPVAGIPLNDGQWDVTWLWDEAGYLEGTAFPTTPGNSVLTSHVYLPDGNAGPFVNIHNLMWGEQIIIHYNGNRYVYEVRDLTRVTPENLSVIDHEAYTWLTLLTCQGFQKDSGEYAYRIAVKAVLIAVESE